MSHFSPAALLHRILGFSHLHLPLQVPFNAGFHIISSFYCFWKKQPCLFVKICKHIRTGIFSCESTLLEIKGYVTSHLCAFFFLRACASLSTAAPANRPYLPHGLWCWIGGFWELCHLVEFGRSFFLAFPQPPAWQAFDGSAATCTNTQTHTCVFTHTTHTNIGN